MKKKKKCFKLFLLIRPPRDALLLYIIYGLHSRSKSLETPELDC